MRSLRVFALFVLCLPLAIGASLLFAQDAPAPTPLPVPADNPPTPAPVPTPTPAPKSVDLRIVVTGDINLNRNRVEVYPDGADVWGTRVPFDSFLQGTKGMIDGDINFGNIETVICDNNDIPEKDKAYCFRTHPNGIRMLLANHFNLLGMANNHSFDYGAEGIRQTLKHLSILEKESKFAWAGIGLNKDQAIRPAILEVKGIKVAMTSLGIGEAAGNHSPGVAQEYYYREALQRLADTKADVLILSCHDGKEGKSYPIDRQLRVYREAISNYGVDIVIGHHPHVVQGIEHYKDGLIFYSLGNFMIRGAADMGKRANAKGIRDFGLMGRIDLTVTPEKGHAFKKLEIIPVYDMHQGVHPFADPAEAYIRVDTVNDLSSYSSLDANFYRGLPPHSSNPPLVFKKKNGIGVVTF